MNRRDVEPGAEVGEVEVVGDMEVGDARVNGARTIHSPARCCCAW